VSPRFAPHHPAVVLGDALISAIGTSVQKKTPASTNSATRSGFRLDRPARPQFFG
jgi:hypothetical protein